MSLVEALCKPELADRMSCQGLESAATFSANGTIVMVVSEGEYDRAKRMQTLEGLSARTSQ